MSRLRLLNTFVDNLTMKEALNQIDTFIKSEKYHYVVTPNVDHIVKLEEDDEFKETYMNADLILTDGMPLIWISKINATPIKEKVSGSDLFPEVCKLAAEKGYKLFLLGAAEGVAQKAAENLKEKYKGLKVVGTYSPDYGFEKDSKKVQEIIKIVNASEPDILAIGLGAPKQEKFMYKYKDKIKVSVALGIGASIDFEAGNIKRAPRWMQNVGLEWMYRLIKEPRRLYKRYIVEDVKVLSIWFKYRNRINQ